MRIRRLTAILIIVVWTMTFGLYSTEVLAESKDTIVITVGSPYMYVNGVKKQLDPDKGTTPQVIESSTYIPLNAFVMEMGGCVTWTANEKRLDIVLGNKTMRMWIEKKGAILDDKQITMAKPPKLVNGLPMVPVRFLAENLGAAISLDKTQKIITVTFVKKEVEVSSVDWGYLLINDFEIKKENVIIKEKAGESYIFINADEFKYAFKYPYLTNIYPEFYRQDNTFAATWSDNNTALLEIIMEVDNPTFSVNGQAADAGMGPFKSGEAYYIPINLFIAAFDMKVDYDKEANSILVQFNKDFPKDILIGYWSDIDTNLFTEFKDPSTGAKSLSSFANAYIYNTDGTYMLRMLAVGGFSDTFIQQSGKYKIIGNMLMHYDISETLYKGTPFVLQYKNKLLDKPEYNFINNYYPDENRIEINLIPVTKKQY